eukprot:2029875-Amphidinium_carterae.1
MGPQFKSYPKSRSSITSPERQAGTYPEVRHDHVRSIIKAVEVEDVQVDISDSKSAEETLRVLSTVSETREWC